MAFGLSARIAGGDVLPVAAEIGEGERLLVEHAQEARRAAAMLDVRLALGVGGGEIERSHAGDEVGERLVDRRGEAALLPPIRA